MGCTGKDFGSSTQNITDSAEVERFRSGFLAIDCCKLVLAPHLNVHAINGTSIMGWQAGLYHKQSCIKIVAAITNVAGCTGGQVQEPSVPTACQDRPVRAAFCRTQGCAAAQDHLAWQCFDSCRPSRTVRIALHPLVQTRSTLFVSIHHC